MKIRWDEKLNRVIPTSEAKLRKEWCRRGIAVFTIVCHLVMVSGISMVLTVIAPVPLAFAATEDVSLIRVGQTMSTVARAGNVVTITLASSYPNNNLVAGQSIVIDAVDNTFDGTFVITGVTDQSTFTYAQTAGDVGSTADAGTAGGDYTTLTAWEAGEGGNLVILRRINDE